MKPRSVWESISKSTKWLLVYPVLLVIPLVISFIFTSLFDSGLLTWVPFNLHSILVADYSADIRGYPLQRVGIGIIEDYYHDQGYTDANVKIGTLKASLLTPVPTVTLFPGNIVPYFTPTNQITPTEISGTSTPTESSINPSLTNTFTPTATSTAQPSPTSQITVIYPTSTPPRQSTPRPTDSPASTSTRVSPTSTRLPPTATRPPPTATRRPPDPYPGPTPYP